MFPKETGAFYTPSPAANYMAGLFKDWQNTDLLWDPAVGDSSLIKACLPYFTPSSSTQIEVWDINPQIIQQIDYPCTVRLRDTLLPWDQVPFTPTKIIANPPYLNKKDYYFKQNRAAIRAAAGDLGISDAYALFLRRSLEALPEGGQLVFLVSDTYRTLKIHQKLRETLLQWQIESITLCPRKLFYDAKVLVYTSIIHLTKIKPPPNHQVTCYDFRQQLDFQNGLTKKIHQQVWHDDAPNQVFYLGEQQNLLKLFRPQLLPKLKEYLLGGVGMYARHNQNFVFSKKKLPRPNIPFLKITTKKVVILLIGNQQGI